MSRAVDRISNLPENLAEIILMHLPLRDAVRTSILSHYWRYRWNMIPQLVFDEKCVSYREGKARKMSDEKLAKIVNEVLLVHHGPIRKFKLSINSKRDVDIDRWILLLSRNGINEFTLEITGRKYYNLPFCFYLCQELTDLRLFGCSINVPLSVKGFGRLRTLSLQYVEFPNSELEMLISLCPLVQILVLRGISGCHTLNLCALKLIDLVVDLDFERFRFENTPLLRSLEINIGLDQVLLDGVAAGGLSQVFGSLPKLEKLHITGRTLEVMPFGDANQLPTAHCLKCLSVDVGFDNSSEVSNLLRILGSSPILRKLNIMVQAPSFTYGILELVTEPTINTIINWEFMARLRKTSGDLYSQLKIVELTNFTGIESELKFVEVVLAYSPLLQKVQIELKQNVSGGPDILSKITRFRRLSSTAQVELQQNVNQFFDGNSDDSFLIWLTSGTETYYG